MIKTIVTHTEELDDEELAIAEIVAGLESGGELLKNSIGIVTCHYEYINTDMFKAICDSLPFDVVGTIASTQAVPGAVGTFLFTLMVLTSDDVEFKKVITSSLLEDPKNAIADGYKSEVGDEKPALIFAFAPFILQNCGDDYVNAVGEVSGGVPCFGTLAVDDSLDFSNSFVLVNGEHYRDKMAMIFVYGDIKPKFFVTSISESKILGGKSAMVTKSAGSVVMEANERPITHYFKELGLLDASETQYAMSSVPFLLDFNDGTPKVSKFFVKLTDEGYAICAGAMPEGSTMHIAPTDSDDVMLTTKNLLDQVNAEIEGASAIMIYSCIGRSITLGSEHFAPMELLDEIVGTKIPYMCATSGGEICPTEVLPAKSVNRFHNNAFIACMF